MTDTWTGRPIGRVRSSLTDLAAAPKQGAESAQTTWIDYTPELAAGFTDIAVGDRLVVLTCGGPFLPEYRSYRDNVVVVAEPTP